MNDNSAPFTHNQILSSLARGELEGLLPMLERTELQRGTVLYHPDSEIDYVYFPDRAMISVVAYTEDGQSAEVAVIGSEGATGLETVMGSDRAANEHITQLANVAVRMRVADVREQFSKGGEFQEVLLKFTRKLIVQISQTALCNRLHTTEKRLSRWLLMCHDRAPADVLNLTQEFIATMLGANRTTVTMTAIALQNLGFIAYSRGTLTIVDRKGLEAFACPCYSTIRAAYGPMPK